MSYASASTGVSRLYLGRVTWFCYSTMGVSGCKWHYTAKAAVMTLLGSFGGGFMGLAFTLLRNKGNVEVIDLINGVLGALVSITGKFTCLPTDLRVSVKMPERRAHATRPDLH